MGISRRIKSVPHGFEIGKTWVAVAHRKAIGPVVCDSCSGLKLAAESDEECEECKGEGVVHKSAIFHLFRPEAIEYVTKGTESEEELDKLVERGITPVRVVVDEESPEGTEEE